MSGPWWLDELVERPPHRGPFGFSRFAQRGQANVRKPDVLPIRCGQAAGTATTVTSAGILTAPPMILGTRTWSSTSR